MFDLVRPCADCPFRSDGAGVMLRPSRIVEIVQAIERQTFACHKTTSRRKENWRHCAGAAIFVEKLGKRGDMLQIAARLGLYDPDRLDMSAPVWNSVEQFLEEGSL